MLSLALAVLLASSPATVTPGSTIGLVSLGDPLTKLQGLGFTPKPQLTGWFDRAPYSVRVEDGKVTIIEYQVGKDEAVNFTLPKIAPGKAGESFTAIAERLGTCGPLDARIGGTLIDCGNGFFLTATIAGLGLRQETPPPSTRLIKRCTHYVTGTVELVPGETWCLDTQQLTTDTPPELIEKLRAPCELVSARGAETLRCRQWHFVYAGPTRRLARIELH